MTNKKKIKTLTKEQLAELISEIVKGNHIEISGVLVSSASESLKSVEETASRLVEKHKDFLLMKRENQLKTGYAG